MLRRRVNTPHLFLRQAAAPLPSISRKSKRERLFLWTALLVSAAALALTMLRREPAAQSELAHGALFLASDESTYVNASTFMVDGGLSGAYLTPRE